MTPNVAEQTDFSMFYIAGYLARTGLSEQLYPKPTETNLEAAAFNTQSHRLLPHLPATTTAFFPYPPLIAFLLAPLSCFSPHVAFIVWQMLSLLGFVVCLILLSLLTKKHWSSYFLYSLLYLPVIHILWIGQINLLLICLPLSLSYFWLKRRQPVPAGLAFSLLLLKPQFLVIPIVFLGSLLAAKQLRCLISFAIGIFIVAVSNIVCFGLTAVSGWILCLKLSASLLLGSGYCSPFLYASLHEAVEQFFSNDMQFFIRIALFALELGIFLHALIFCARLVSKTHGKYLLAAPFVFATSIFILPLVSPHLRCYDLSVFALPGIVLFEHPWVKKNLSLTHNLQLLWLLINLYTITIAVAGKLAQPLLLILTIVWFYIQFLRALQSLPDNPADIVESTI